jgi:undecaprenyl-diphosphatase
MGLGGGNQKAAVNTFEIVIQGGAILAVLGLYWPRFLRMLLGLLGRDPAGLRLFINVVVASIPPAAVGLLFKKRIEEHLFALYPVAAALMLGGLYMIGVEWWRARHRRLAQSAAAPRTFGAADGRDTDTLTVKDAAFVGLLQCAALIPGVSRSMMTITGGLFRGLRPAAAAEFSFLLGVPLLLAATGLKLVENLRTASATGGPNFIQELGIGPVVLGMVVAGVSAAVAVKWLVGFLNRFGLVPFGIYRIVLGGTLILLVQNGLVAVAR